LGFVVCEEFDGCGLALFCSVVFYGADAMAQLEPKASLWTFACGVYENPEVKAPCLALQDQFGANVDIILWMCWLACRDIPVRRPLMSRALAVVSGEDQRLLDQLRELRKLASEGTHEGSSLAPLMREQILATELAIEKVLLRRLEILAVPDVSPLLKTRPINSVSVMGGLGQLRFTAVGQVTLVDYFVSLKVEHAAKYAGDLTERSLAFWRGHSQQLVFNRAE
jgi:uncharacterized protein (TIGR02444 family)